MKVLKRELILETGGYETQKEEELFEEIENTEKTLQELKAKKSEILHTRIKGLERLLIEIITAELNGENYTFPEKNMELLRKIKKELLHWNPRLDIEKRYISQRVIEWEQEIEKEETSETEKERVEIAQAEWKLIQTLLRNSKMEYPNKIEEEGARTELRITKMGNKNLLETEEIVNLTPHAINLPGETIPAPEKGVKIPRIEQNMEHVILIGGGIEIRRGMETKTISLPKEKEGILLVVSSLVRLANPERKDLVSPDTSPTGVVRDENGRIIGVKGFQI